MHFPVYVQLGKDACVWSTEDFNLKHSWVLYLECTKMAASHWVSLLCFHIKSQPSKQKVRTVGAEQTHGRGLPLSSMFLLFLAVMAVINSVSLCLCSNESSFPPGHQEQLSVLIG